MREVQFVILTHKPKNTSHADIPEMCVCFQIAQLDEVKIRISALRSIIDLLLLFGFELLSGAAATQTAPSSQSPDRQEEDAQATEEKGDIPEDSAQSILVMLSEFLDSEVRVDCKIFPLKTLV